MLHVHSVRDWAKVSVELNRLVVFSGRLQIYQDHG